MDIAFLERLACDFPGVKASPELLEKRFDLFDAYLTHGGFLTPKNDMARDGTIAPATSAVYSDWIRGDVLKRGKHEPYLREVPAAVADPRLSSRLAEAAAVSHVRRLYTTDYIKAEGEVDIAFVRDNAIHPVEVKWAGQLRPKDLKQVKKYPQARIWTRQASFRSLHGLPAEPLPAALWRLGS